MAWDLVAGTPLDDPNFAVFLVISAALTDLGYRAETFGGWWSDSVVGGFPHDAIVPTSNMAMPNAVPVFVSNTTHIQETSSLPTRAAMLSAIQATP